MPTAIFDCVEGENSGGVDGTEKGDDKEIRECDGRGRPSKCPRAIAEHYYTSFTSGKLVEHFFGERPVVLKRLLCERANLTSFLISV